MSSFTDAGGRHWLIEINVAQVKRVRALLKLDLLALVQDGLKPLANLLGDVVQLVDVLYILCLSQCKERQVSDEDFGRLMAGDVLEQATAAFLESLTDFFPDAKVRASLRTMMQKGRAVQELATARMTKEVEGLDPEKILTALLKGKPAVNGLTSGSLSSSLPASPDAIPDH